MDGQRLRLWKYSWTLIGWSSEQPGLVESSLPVAEGWNYVVFKVPSMILVHGVDRDDKSTGIVEPGEGLGNIHILVYNHHGHGIGLG